MSLRERFPQAQLPRSHYFITLARGESLRTFAVRPWLLWATGSCLCALFLCGAGLAAYVFFRDDMLAAFLSREAEMQAAYEDRLADARAALDRLAGRQLLDQNSFEGKLHELLSRQAQLEQRGAMVAAIANQATGRAGALPDGRAHASLKAANSALSAIGAATNAPASDSLIDGAAQSFAPTDSPVDRLPQSLKPRPLDEPTVHSKLEGEFAPPDSVSAELAAAIDDDKMAPAARLSLISLSLDRTERKQIVALHAVDATARKASDRWRAVVAVTGLSVDDLTPPQGKGGVGGPFIPVDIDPKASVFEQSVARTERDVVALDRVARLLPYLPLRKPLLGDAVMTSPFGYRPDPFLGRPELHPGVDLVQAYGADIHATAAGKVVHAGWMGGYGNMVEIDHGNGLTTRYGHMSEVLVSEGDDVKFGDVIGRVGSTGRSTGPHLHYEVRIDGEPVDPERFLAVAGNFAP